MRWMSFAIVSLSTGDRLQTGELHLDAVDGERVLDLAEVVGQRGVVVADERDRRDRVLAGLVGERRQCGCAVRGPVGAVDLEDLVGMVREHRVQAVLDLRGECGVVDGLALGCRVQHENVAARVTTEGAVGQFCGRDRL